MGQGIWSLGLGNKHSSEEFSWDFNGNDDNECLYERCCSESGIILEELYLFVYNKWTPACDKIACGESSKANPHTQFGRTYKQNRV